MVLPESFSYQATPELAKRALWLFLLRRSLVGIILTTLLSIVCLYQFFTTRLFGDLNSWLLLFTGTVWMGPTIQTIQAFQKTDIFFRTQKDPNITVRVDEDAIAFDSFGRKSETAWHFIPEILKSPDVWLVFYYFKDGTFNFIPTTACPPELLAVIESKVREAGGKVS